MKNEVSWRTKILVRLMMLCMAITLAGIALSAPSESSYISQAATYRVKEAGVESPVTAVLIHFRGYDTMLEVTVMLLVAIGAMAVGKNQDESQPALLAQKEETLLTNPMIRLLLPIMLMVSIYYLWAGAKKAGGAFQAGTVLGSMGIMLLLAQKLHSSNRESALWRILLVVGPFTFVTLSFVSIFFGNAFLDFPQFMNSQLIFCIEAMVSISTGAIFCVVFARCSNLSFSEKQ